MKRYPVKKVIGIFVSATGVSAVALAMAARVLGISREVGWGSARTFLLFVGISFIFMPHIQSLSHFIARGAAKLGNVLTDFLGLKLLTRKLRIFLEQRDRGAISLTGRPDQQLDADISILARDSEVSSGAAREFHGGCETSSVQSAS